MLRLWFQVATTPTLGAASNVIPAGSDGRVASPGPAGDRVVDDTGPEMRYEEVDVAELLGQTMTDNENYDHRTGTGTRTIRIVPIPVVQ